MSILIKCWPLHLSTPPFMSRLTVLGLGIHTWTFRYIPFFLRLHQRDMASYDSEVSAAGFFWLRDFTRICPYHFLQRHTGFLISCDAIHNDLATWASWCLMASAKLSWRYVFRHSHDRGLPLEPFYLSRITSWWSGGKWMCWKGGVRVADGIDLGVFILLSALSWDNILQNMVHG